MVAKEFNVVYPYVLHTIAEDIHIVRTNSMLDTYKGKAAVGAKRQKEVNVQGLLAELIAWHYYECKEQKYSAPPLLDDKPIVGADIIVGELKIDVKYIPPYARYLMLNYDSHFNQEKKIDGYLFVQPLHRLNYGEAIAKVWYYTHKEVDSWKVQTHRTKVLCQNLKHTQN